MIYLLVFLAAFLAFTISALCGGGAGLALMPLLALVVTINNVPAALAIGTASSAATRAVLFRRDIRWDLVRWFLPAAVPSTILGVWLLSIAQPIWLEFLLGLFLTANLTMLFRKQKRRVPKMPGRVVIFAIGGVAGLISGFTGAVGVVFNGFYLRSGLSKAELVATRGANEVLLHVLKIGLYAFFGLLGADALRAGIVIATAAVLASLAARSVLHLLSEPLFRRVNYAVMGVAGIAMMASAGSVLAARYDVAWGGKLDAGIVEARISMGQRALSFEWKSGGGPEIERTVSANHLPARIREAAATFVGPDGTKPATYEEVRSLRGLSYEVRVDGVTRHLVVTD